MVTEIYTRQNFVIESDLENDGYGPHQGVHPYNQDPNGNSEEEPRLPRSWNWLSVYERALPVPVPWIWLSTL